MLFFSFKWVTLSSLFGVLALGLTPAAFANALANAAAPAKMICAKKAIQKYRSSIDQPHFYDKFKHCTFSCVLALKCGTAQAWAAGALKELQDIFTPGNADWKDMRANQIGIQFVTLGQAADAWGCQQKCGTVFPPSTPNTPYNPSLFDL
jgi:hypothetical protein